MRRPTLWLHGALAAVAYLPLLWSSPGLVSADTKSYLTLDPSRLLAKTPYLWDPAVGMGTVTHQTIGYLWPFGPYYWTMEHLGVPDWVAQRLWLGTVLFAAGAGVVFLLRTWRVPLGAAPAVAAFAYLLSPYVLDYAARLSVILLPWAALPWLIAFTARSLRGPTWRWPALFALTVTTAGSVNATAIVLAGLGPALWVPWAIWGARETTPRRAAAAVGRLGLLTVGVSLWWLAALLVQGRYGIPILRYTETYKAVAGTSSPGEVLRGLGYWFFYGADPVDRWVGPSRPFLDQQWLVVAGYTSAAGGLVSLAAVRFRHRGFVALLLVTGVVVSVGGYPYGDGTLAGRAIEAFVATPAGRALRSTPRAVPLVALALAVALGFGTAAAAGALAGRRSWAPVVVPVAAVVLLAVAMPPLFTGGEYSSAILRKGGVPQDWQAATNAFDAGDHRTRVYELPGADFARYRWGGTVDPITPGLVDRPYVARELVPWGSAPSADLLNAFEERLHDGVFEPAALAPFARLISAGTLSVRNDLQYERYRTPRPRPFWQQVLSAPGLAAPVAHGPPSPNRAVERRPFLDETALAIPPGTPDPPTVAGIDVPGAPPIIHAEPAARPLVVAGDGEGLVDAAAGGLLDDRGAVLYAAGLTPAQLDQAAADGADLLITDSNRRRARRWGSVGANVGYTERAAETSLADDPTDNRLDLFPGTGDDAATVSEQRSVRTVDATSYGNPVTYTPEDRAAHAMDGDPITAWRTGALTSVEGERLVVTLDQPVTTDHLTLLQPTTGPRNRWMTSVRLRFNGDQTLDVDLDDTSRVAPGQHIDIGRRPFSTLELTVTDDNYGTLPGYNGLSAVGVADLQLGDDGPRVEEVVRLPQDLLAAVGPAVADHRLTLLLTRQRADPHESTRSDPETALLRTFTVPTARTFTLNGTARLSGVAPDPAVDAALGATGPAAATASAHLPGEPVMRGAAAIDADLATAWQTPLAEVHGQALTVTAPSPVTVDHLDLTVIADGRHSVPTALALAADGGPAVDVAVPPVPDDRSRENATARVRVDLPAPITARTLTVTLTAIRAMRTPDDVSGEPTDLPVGVAELGAGGFTEPAPAGRLPGACRVDLVTVDGAAVPVRVTGSVADAVARRPLPVEACGPALTLTAGRHDVRTAVGRDLGIDVDRLVLDSAAPGPRRGRPAAPTVHVTGQTRVSSALRIDGATEPFWLVLGQSHNDGWHARLDGDDLGPATVINGFANGWRITPPPGGQSLTVTLTWTPQRLVWFGLAASALTMVACIVVVAVDRRRGPQPVAAPSRRAPAAPALIVAATIAFALVAGPAGAVAAAATGVAARYGSRRLRRWLPLVPGLLLAGVAAYIVAKTVRYPIPPDLNWPAAFAAVDPLAWAAVAAAVTQVIVARPEGFWSGPRTGIGAAR